MRVEDGLEAVRASCGSDRSEEGAQPVDADRVAVSPQPTVVGEDKAAFAEVAKPLEKSRTFGAEGVDVLDIDVEHSTF